MRLLADEGVDGLIVNAVRDDGHDVRWMAEEVDGTKAALSSRRPSSEVKKVSGLFSAKHAGRPGWCRLRRPRKES